MRIIEQLNKLPIRTGHYLVLPNIDTPYFIMPVHTRRNFLTSISFIKSKNLKGKIKKHALKIIPIFILKMLFTVIYIKTKDCNNNFHQLILPWNQDVTNKFTIFNFNESEITLLKVGFGDYKSLICNEHSSLLNAPDFGKDLIPEIIGFSESKEFTIIETLFYDGDHPSYLPLKINDFFEKIKVESQTMKMKEHPYVIRIFKVVNKVLRNESLDVLLNEVLNYFKKYENILVPVVLMHGDCSKSNVISNNGIDMLIDWEDCITDGVPIDIRYFDFRLHIDNGKCWEINNEIDFLVILHYIYLKIKYNNISSLQKISLKGFLFSL
jgi:hypothetical protein